MYHVFQMHDRVRQIDLRLSPSIWHKVVVLMDEHFPILERLSLYFVKISRPLTLPKAFLAPNLRHLALYSISPPRRLRLLTSTISLVTLTLSNIQTSSYFRPRLLVARLRSLPQLEELFIAFSTPIPRPRAERELLGEQRSPVTLPSLKKFHFQGVGAYLEALVAQIRAPLLEWLKIKLFNQIALALPHLSYLVSITERFKLPSATVVFGSKVVDVSMVYYDGTGFVSPFILCVFCKPLDWQIDCAAQICHALIPALSRVQTLTLFYHHLEKEISRELRNGGIDSATWHDLLRSFIGMTELGIDDMLLEELSRALQVDEVGSDPGFLPNLQYIQGNNNLFTSFIDTRQVVGRPVQYQVVKY